MYVRLGPESDYTMGVNISTDFHCSRPRLCENSNSKIPSGKMLLIYLVFGSDVL